MGQITNEMVKASYDIGKKIYQGEIILDQGLEILNMQYSMDVGSAKDYINNYKCLMNGEQYKRTMNEYATKYYLIRILLDNGNEIFSNALVSLRGHLEYQDNIGKNALLGIRNIYNIFINIRDNNYLSFVEKAMELF